MEYNADDNSTATGPAHAQPENGLYSGHARSWAWDTDKSGNPCITFVFTLDASNEHDFAGYQLDGRLYLDEDKADKLGRTALTRSMEALRAMGLEGDLPEDIERVDLSQGVVELKVERNPKGYAFAHYINAPRGEYKRELRVFQSPDAPALKGFLAKLNSRSRALDAKAAASGTTPVSRTNTSAQQPQTARQQQARPATTQQAQQAQQQPAARGPGVGRPPPRQEQMADDPDSIPF